MENLFLVCLVPPVSIIEDIDDIRKFISEKFDVHESLKRPAHITLYNPVKLTSLVQEQKFFGALNRAAHSEPFNQVLKNFNSFPEHTFYLDLEQNEGIMNLKLEINKELKPLALINARENFKFTPHLTLAFKDVKPEVFRAITAEFKDRKFKRQFSVAGFSVYKNIDKKWQPFKEIAFKPAIEKPKPLSLF